MKQLFHLQTIKLLAAFFTLVLSVSGTLVHAQEELKSEMLSLDLAQEQVMDLDQERDRLAGEIRKVEAEIAKLDKKLADRQFLAKAPPEVVETQKERRAKEAQLREKLTAAMARLAG